MQVLCFNALGHFIPIVLADGVDLLLGDNAAHADQDGGFVLALFCVVFRIDRLARVGEDEKLNTVVAERFEDLLHKIAEAVEIVDDEHVDLAAGRVFEHLGELGDVFFGAVEREPGGAGFSGDGVITDVDEAARVAGCPTGLKLVLEGDLVGFRLGFCGDSLPGGVAEFHGCSREFISEGRLDWASLRICIGHQGRRQWRHGEGVGVPT